MKGSRVLFLIGTSCAALAASPALSQNTTAPVGAGSPPAGDAATGPAETTPTNTPALADTRGQSTAATDGGLQEIVVTAQKTTSNVQRTPIALRVVSGDDLRISNVTDVNNLTRLAPDLNVSTDTIYTKLSLRGISAESIAEGADSALTVNIDGEYIMT